MRLAILSRAPRAYSTKRLVQAAQNRGHEVDLVDVLECTVSLEEGYPDLYHRGNPLAEFDAVLPRIGASVTFYGTAVLRQMEQMDIYCANRSEAILNSRDKLRSLQILSRYHLGIPATEFVVRKQDVMPAIERVGGAPVIIKLLEGTQGVGVILADTKSVAAAIIETLHSTRQNVLIQKFVAESKGRDVRAFVIGDRVVAAMRRVAQGQEFRSNVHRGGLTEPIELDEEYTATAVRAAQILGLRIAGVDMLEGADGPQIAEVNSSPGLEGIETATGKDIAGAVIDSISENVDFPELDIRQRLTSSRGYGVAELPIGELTGLAGKTIATCGLREEDVQILTLFRDGRAIQNPRSTRQLEIGDRLLCFGKLELLRGFLPDRKPTRVRKLHKKDRPR